MLKTLDAIGILSFFVLIKQQLLVIKTHGPTIIFSKM